MEIIPPYLRFYQQILKDLENAFPYLNEPNRILPFCVIYPSFYRQTIRKIEKLHYV